MKIGKAIFLLTFVTLLGSCDKDPVYDPYGQVQLGIDISILDKYLAENNIVAQKSNSGLRYVVHDFGLGIVPQRGNQVRVHYTGKLLDGTTFDSSYDRGEPITYQFGYGQVIRGWEEGLSYISERGKMTLYIPSVLAYGNQAKGDLITPNSNLIFDIELISVQ